MLSSRVRSGRIAHTYFRLMCAKYEDCTHCCVRVQGALSAQIWEEKRGPDGDAVCFVFDAFLLPFISMCPAAAKSTCAL